MAFSDRDREIEESSMAADELTDFSDSLLVDRSKEDVSSDRSLVAR